MLKLSEALLATGVSPKEFHERGITTTSVRCRSLNRVGLGSLKAHVAYVSTLYRLVADGRMTLEQLVDYVRSIEPAEPTISILPSRKPLVRIPEGSDQGDEQPGWDDTDTSRELYSGIRRGCQ